MYECKVCGLPVWIAHWNIDTNEVLQTSVESGDKLRDVDECPRCGNRLICYDDLFFNISKSNEIYGNRYNKWGVYV